MELADCGFSDDSSWFRLRACAIILDGDRVLMARNSTEPYYYAVGGGVKLGESVTAAVRREVREETGWTLEIERLVFIHENFFTGPTTELTDLACHEVAFYFLMTPPPADQPPLVTVRPDGVTELVEWVPLAEYGRHRPAYPTFLGAAAANLPSQPQLITTYE